MLAFLVFFHAFCCTDNLTAANDIHADNNKDRNILNFAAPATFQVETINIDIWIAAGQRTCTPGFDMLICFLLRLLMVPRDSFVSHKASVILPTRRTETPARYISIRASSTEDSCDGNVQ